MTISIYRIQFPTECPALFGPNRPPVSCLYIEQEPVTVSVWVFRRHCDAQAGGGRLTSASCGVKGRRHDTQEPHCHLLWLSVWFSEGCVLALSHVWHFNSCLMSWESLTVTDWGAAHTSTGFPPSFCWFPTELLLGFHWVSALFFIGLL